MQRTVATQPGQNPVVIALTQQEVAARQAEEAVLTTQSAARDTLRRAQAALEKSDLVAIRCVKAGITFPAEWQAYVADLRAIIGGSEDALPGQPNFPAGT